MKKDKTISDASLANIELNKSPVYAKMSDIEKEYYINSSLEIGNRIAKQFKAKKISIYDLCKNEGINVVVKLSKKNMGDFIMRGEINYNQGECEIIIYEDSINQLYENSRKSDYRLSKSQCKQLHLCHEFFHYYEFKENNEVSKRLNQLEFKGLFNRTVKREVFECSEIAAHSFVKEFCSLQVLPNYYDVYKINQLKINRL